MLKKTAPLLVALTTIALASCSAKPSGVSGSTGGSAGTKTGEAASETKKKAPAKQASDGASKKAPEAKTKKQPKPEATSPKDAPVGADPSTSSDPIAAIEEFISNAGIDTARPRWRKALPMPPKLRFPTDKKYFWDLETTEGPIRIQFMPDVAPMHVSSTIYLTKLGFYDGLLFHRVIDGFMAQGGCPTGDGRGGPGYKYAGEFRADVKHDRPGLLSMANAGPGTDGSQFFITFTETRHLNNKHTIFGEVVEGMDTVRALEAQGSRSGQTKKQLSIVDASIAVE